VSRPPATFIVSMIASRMTAVSSAPGIPEKPYLCRLLNPSRTCTMKSRSDSTSSGSGPSGIPASGGVGVDVAGALNASRIVGDEPPFPVRSVAITRMPSYPFAASSPASRSMTHPEPFGCAGSFGRSEPSVVEAPVIAMAFRIPDASVAFASSVNGPVTVPPSSAEVPPS
jgi:hypothetical protein